MDGVLLTEAEPITNPPGEFEYDASELAEVTDWFVYDVLKKELLTGVALDDECIWVDLKDEDTGMGCEGELPFLKNLFKLAIELCLELLYMFEDSTREVDDGELAKTLFSGCALL